MKTSAAPSPGIRTRIVVYVMSKHSLQVALFYVDAHSFCHHSFWTVCQAVLQPGDAHKSTFLQIGIHFRTCRISILEDATFHRMNWCMFLLRNPCRAIETFYSWDSSLWALGFSTHFSGFGCVIFARLLTSWRKLQLSPLEHCPLAFHCQQSPRILCTRCFVPWFLTTAFLSYFLFLASKFLIRRFCSILLFTIVFNLWQSGPNFFWWVSKSYNSNTRKVFQTLVFLICTIFPRCHQVGFSSPTSNRIPEYHHFVDW